MSWATKLKGKGQGWMVWGGFETKVLFCKMQLSQKSFSSTTAGNSKIRAWTKLRVFVSYGFRRFQRFLKRCWRDATNKHQDLWLWELKENWGEHNWVYINRQRRRTAGRAPGLWLEFPHRKRAKSQVDWPIWESQADSRKVWPQGCVLQKKLWVSLDWLLSHSSCCLKPWELGIALRKEAVWEDSNESYLILRFLPSFW